MRACAEASQGESGEGVDNASQQSQQRDAIELTSSSAVLQKMQNRSLPNGPTMVDGWVVRLSSG